MSNPTPRQYFFIHVMKTAGTTFVRQLQQEFAPEAIYPARNVDWTGEHDYDVYINIPRLLALTPERRAEIRVFTGHFPYMVCDLVAPGCTTLSVLREPVARTVSVLKHFKRVEARFHECPLEAIYDDRQIFRFFVENHQTKVFSLVPSDNEVAINCGLTTDDERYERARASLAQVDVLGITEEYNRFVDETQRRFGWWGRGVDRDLRTNVSTEDWDVEPSFRARIAADNAYDVALYEYARTLIRSR
jgi:hypothetical protein